MLLAPYPLQNKRRIGTHEIGKWVAVAYPGFFFSGGGVQQIQLRAEDRDDGDLGAVAP